jgi:hypothetical protein
VGIVSASEGPTQRDRGTSSTSGFDHPSLWGVAGKEDTMSLMIDRRS